MKNNKGITTISLVITIIILIILAGVSISIIIGQNGLINKTQEARSEYEETARTQMDKFANMDVLATTPGKSGKAEKNKMIKFKDGTEKKIGGNESLKSDYQKIVHPSFFSSNENNVQSGEDSWEWQLFYDDDTYIFLIASDYVPKSTLPAEGNTGYTKNGNLCKVDLRYQAKFSTDYTDYVYASGTIYKSGLAATPLTSNPLTNTYLKWVALNSSSANYNIPALIFMMDREKWSGYAGNKYTGAFAIGGPTVEMFNKSWNAYPDHSSLQLGSYDTLTSGTNYDANGYKIWKVSTGEWADRGAVNDLGTTTNMWFIHETSKAVSYWLAAPSSYSPYALCEIAYSGALSGTYATDTVLGFRPIVVIPKASIKGTSSVTNANNKTDNYANPYIPAGFTHTEGEWNSGYTIKNSTTNDEFVWVPCTLTATSETVALARKTDGIYNPNSLTNIADQSGAKADLIKTSVGTYGGFYIAKYEASNSSETAKSVPNATPWINITRTNAIAKAEAMVNTSDGVKSALISGECWDTTLQWMVTKSANATTNAGYDIDSTGKGCYQQGSVATTGSSTAYAVNNIYDMAGNVFEWTTENCKYNNSDLLVVRGGHSGSLGSYSPAASRYQAVNNTSSSTGFRVVLYKE